MESEGGPIPDDLVEIVDTGQNDEYSRKTNIWIEFCIRSSFSKASQAFKFIYDIMKMSAYTDSAGHAYKMASECYIHPKLVGETYEYTNMQYFLPAKAVKRIVDNFNSPFDEIIEPAMILCNHSSNAYENLLQETHKNVFPLENTKFNEEISKKSYGNIYKSFDDIRFRSLTSFNPKRLWQQHDIQVIIKNVAYNDSNSDFGSGKKIFIYGNQIPWEKKLINKVNTLTSVKDIRFSRIKDMRMNASGDFDYQAFIWVGVITLEDTYAVGLNTYNVFASVIKPESQLESFKKTLSELFPGSITNRVNEDYVDLIDADEISREETQVENRPIEDFDLQLTLDWTSIEEYDIPKCLRKLENAFAQIPGIYDYTVTTEARIQTVYTKIGLNTNFRNVREIFNMMRALEIIFNPDINNRMEFIFNRPETSQKNITFRDLMHYLE